jgi:hypothetical protein
MTGGRGDTEREVSQAPCRDVKHRRCGTSKGLIPQLLQVAPFQLGYGYPCEMSRRLPLCASGASLR